MNSTLWTTLFAVLMAGAILVMLAILAGLVADGTRRTRDRSAWLPGLRPPCLAMQRNARVQRTDWIGR